MSNFVYLRFNRSPPVRHFFSFFIEKNPVLPGSNSRPNVSEGYMVTSELPYKRFLITVLQKGIRLTVAVHGILTLMTSQQQSLDKEAFPSLYKLQHRIPVSPTALYPDQHLRSVQETPWRARRDHSAMLAGNDSPDGVEGGHQY